MGKLLLSFPLLSDDSSQQRETLCLGTLLKICCGPFGILVVIVFRVLFRVTVPILNRLSGISIVYIEPFDVVDDRVNSAVDPTSCSRRLHLVYTMKIGWMMLIQVIWKVLTRYSEHLSSCSINSLRKV